MGAGIRNFDEIEIGSFLSPSGSDRVYKYQQQLIHESQHFEVMPHGDLFHTGSPAEYDDINRKVDRFIENHIDELKAKRY